MKFSGKVSASVCDAEARLSLLGAVCMVQDYVSEFYGNNSIDQTSLRKNYNAMWVFTKNRIRFFRPIMWNEELEIECFVSSLTNAKMVVDTIFYSNGERVLYSQIENCMIDLSTQKIRRIEGVFPEGFTPDQSSMEGGFFRLDKLEYLEEERIKIRSTSIDYCKHTNNTEYVRFILNSFSVAELSAPILKFEIHYLAQTHEGDELTLAKQKIENRTFVLLTKDGKKVAECVIE